MAVSVPTAGRAQATYRSAASTDGQRLVAIDNVRDRMKASHAVFDCRGYALVTRTAVP